MNTEEQDLEAMLTGQKPQHQEIAEADVVPKVIKMTPKAMEKARLLGPEAARIGGGAYEWYGLLLANSDDPEFIVRDVILAPDQTVSGAHVQVDGVKVAKAMQEIKELNTKRGTNYCVVGWIHNHANFHTFHSGTDVDNFKTVLNSVSLNTESAVSAELSLIESKPDQALLEDRIKITGDRMLDGSVEYSIKDEAAALALLEKYGVKPEMVDGKVAIKMLNDLLGVTKVAIKEPKIIGFAYSIVVNNAGDLPYSEIAVLEEFPISKKKIHKTPEEIPVQIVEVADDITFTKEEVEKEIKDKLKFPSYGFISKFLGRGRGGKTVYGNGRFLGYWDRYGDFDIDTAAEQAEGVEVVTPAGQTEFQLSDASNVHQLKTIDTVVSKPEMEKFTESPKNLKKLARVFVEKALDYIDQYRYSHCQYSGFMDKLMGAVVGGKSVAEAFEQQDELGRDVTATLPQIHKIIYRVIAKYILKDLIGEKKNQDVMNFMLEFVQADVEGQNKIIEKYFSALGGESDGGIKHG